MSQCNIVIVGELKNKYHKTPNSITTDWRISDGAQRLYQLLLILEFKQKYITYEFLSSIIKKPNGKFQSTLPRGSDTEYAVHKVFDKISIHAPSRERRRNGLMVTL